MRENYKERSSARGSNGPAAGRRGDGSGYAGRQRTSGGDGIARNRKRFDSDEQTGGGRGFGGARGGAFKRAGVKERTERDEEFRKNGRGGASSGAGRSRTSSRPSSRGEGRYGSRPASKTPYKSASKQTSRVAKPVVKETENESVRLNKFIANSGICSRREADEFIAAGLVSVNGNIVTELGTKVFPSDIVKFNGEKLQGEEKVYIVMNKPKDFVTTVSDPHAEKTVLQLIQGQCKQRVYPVGRLDKATTGVLLLTNDGNLADMLTHPSYEKKKIYHVFLDKNCKFGDMKALMEGITLEDGFIQADTIEYVGEDKSEVGVEIHSGRNRIVRRMFEHFGYRVRKLDRVYFAGLTKKKLRRGQWRFLTDTEVAMLKMGSYE